MICTRWVCQSGLFSQNKIEAPFVIVCIGIDRMNEVL